MTEDENIAADDRFIVEEKFSVHDFYDSDTDISIDLSSESEEDSEFLPVFERERESHDWTEVTADDSSPPLLRFPFTGQPRLNVKVENKDDPLEYFSLFFTDTVIQHIVTETNRFAHKFLGNTNISEFSRANKYVDTNSEEIKTFLALLILQGILKKPKEAWFWSRNQFLETPIFGRLMSEKRYSLLMKFLHFTNDEEFDQNAHPHPKLWKIWNIFEMVSSKFSSVYTPERDVCIDESMALYKGKLSWKHSESTKNYRMGIKLFLLCESFSGYIWKVLLYTGKETKFCSIYDDYALGTKCAMSLMHDLLQKGYCVAIDKFYLSHELAERLIELKTDVFGTINPNTKNLPLGLRDRRLKPGEVIAYQKGKMLVFKFEDKKSVCFLSTIHSIDEKEIRNRNKSVTKKPTVAFDYEKVMSDTCRQDQCYIYHPGATKRQKRYYKIFFRQLLDQAVWNAFVLFQKNGGSLEHLDFRVRLVERLCETWNSNPKPEVSRTPVIGRRPEKGNILRYMERHFPSYVPPTGKKLEPTRRCVICCARVGENGKKIRRETRYWCRICQVGLCTVPCFERYHTKPAD
ncbi:PiggyBac transposable element-derived protein 4, partial [Stegodyphus mimosarum]